MRHPTLLAIAVIITSVPLLGYTPARPESLIKVTPILQVQQMYDDNIRSSAVNPEGDFITNALLGFQLDLLGGARNGSFKYETNAQMFASHPSLNNIGETNFINLNGQENLSPVSSVSLTDSFVMANNSTGLLNGAGAASLNSQVALAAINNTSTASNSFSVQYNRQLNERWSTSFTLEQEFFSSGSFGGDSFQQGGGFAAYYRLNPKTRVGMSYDFTDFRFSGTRSAFRSSGTTSAFRFSGTRSATEDHFVQLFLEWNLTPELGFRGSGGGLLADTLDTGGIQVKPGGTATAYYNGERWQLQLNASQTPGITGFGGGGITRSVSGEVTYDLYRHTSLFAGMSYYQFQGSREDTQFTSYGGGLNYQPTRWLTLFAQYADTRRSLNGSSVPLATGRGAFLAPGQQAVTNLYMVGASISFEAFRRAF